MSLKKIIGKIKNIIKYNRYVYLIYYILFNTIMKGVNALIKKDNIILFVCYGGRKFDDSPRVVYEYIKQLENFAKYKKVWAFENPDDFVQIPENEKININSLKYFWISMKAKYWITNSSVQRGLNYKNRKNIYINFQHGTLGMKRIGKSMNALNTSFKVRSPEKFDYFFIQGKKEKQWLAEDLQIDSSKIQLLGLPRNIDLYELDEKQRILAKQKLNIPLDKKAILYAPTFRENNISNNRLEYIFPFNYERLKEHLKDEYILLVTNHYEATRTNYSNDNFRYQFFNYPYLNDLIQAADILLTDYSSIAFDGFVAEIPVLCYGYDYKEYFAQRGKPYIPLEQLFKDGVIENQKQLEDILKKFDYEEEKLFSIQQKNKYIYSNKNCLSDCIDAIFG